MTNNPPENLIHLKNIQLTLEKKDILKDIYFELRRGEIACLLGPSGCGKTSLLRVIAGLEERAIGEITLNQKLVLGTNTFIKPQKRHIGMVFQDYALFPHLTVAQNITFGLAHLSSAEQKKMLEKMLDLTQLNSWSQFYPHKLSGGQQQRVALARALAQSPEILLLDEPFSNLDTELRYQLSEDVRGILKQLNMTAILVTHDQTEAFSFADKIGVMKEGKIEQFSTSYQLYHSPQTPFVASFIGEGVIVDSNLVRPYLPDLSSQVVGSILIRPDDITHDDHSPLKARIFKKIFRGSHFLYVLDFDNGLRVLSLIQSHHDHSIGDLIGLRVEIDHIVEF